NRTEKGQSEGGKKTKPTDAFVYQCISPQNVRVYHRKPFCQALPQSCRPAKSSRVRVPLDAFPQSLQPLLGVLAVGKSEGRLWFAILVLILVRGSGPLSLDALILMRRV
ncbi:MAG: hypothetical protein ACXU9B_16450, partial [Reyranella sp.]